MFVSRESIPTACGKAAACLRMAPALRVIHLQGTLRAEAPEILPGFRVQARAADSV